LTLGQSQRLLELTNKDHPGNHSPNCC
jgi:hypothetical protein